MLSEILQSEQSEKQLQLAFAVCAEVNKMQD